MPGTEAGLDEVVGSDSGLLLRVALRLGPLAALGEVVGEAVGKLVVHTAECPTRATGSAPAVEGRVQSRLIASITKSEPCECLLPHIGTRGPDP